MFEIIGKIAGVFMVVAMIVVIEDMVNNFIKVDMVKYFSRKQRLFYNITQKMTGLIMVALTYFIFFGKF